MNILRNRYFFAALGPAERAARVVAARERIAAAERKRREAKAQRLAKLARKRGNS